MGLFEKIKAIHVLQRFVRMSRVLLPVYVQLKHKQNLVVEEKQRLENIREIYSNFRADSKTSVYLINSNILDLIQTTFRSTDNGKIDTPEGFYTFDQFIKESDRLIDEWNRQLLN